MKGIRTTHLFAISLALIGSSSALSAIPVPCGWYLEGNAGKSKVTDSSYASPSSTKSNGFGWNVNGGYKFLPYFAAEIGYTKNASASSSFNGTKVASASLYSYDLAGKGILPISDSGFELFAKLGAARINANVTGSNPTFAAANGVTVNSGKYITTGYYFGIGGDYAVTPNIPINVQWQRAKGSRSTGSLNLVSIGVSFLYS